MSEAKARPEQYEDAVDVTARAAFLQFIEEQMTKHPEETVPADADQLDRIGRLVGSD
jgi:hypothetical protein